MSKIYNMALIEFIQTLRTAKRQLKFLRSVELTKEEREKLLKAIETLQEDFEIYKI